MAAEMGLLLVTFLSLAFCAVATASWIPPAIEVPRAGHRYNLQHTVHARGYQYYRFNGTAWVNFNAKARLYESEKKITVRVGEHFYLAHPDAYGGQPTWESLPLKETKSGHGVLYSSVTCKAVSRVTVDQDSIPWVLLESTQSKGDKTYFGGVAFVQRINTKKGLAPKSTKRAEIGAVHKSPYSADYLFYVSETNHH